MGRRMLCPRAELQPLCSCMGAAAPVLWDAGGKAVDHPTHHEVRQHHVGEAVAAQAPRGHLRQPLALHERLEHQHQRSQRRVGRNLHVRSRDEGVNTRT